MKVSKEERAKIMEQLNDPEVLNEVLQEKGIETMPKGSKKEFNPSIEVPEIKVSEDMELKDIATQFNAALKTISDQVSESVKSSVSHTKESMEEEKKTEHQKKVQKFAEDHPLMKDDTFLAVMDVEYQKNGDLESAYEKAQEELNMSEEDSEKDGDKKDKKKEEKKSTKDKPVPSSPKSADTGDVDEDELEPETPPTLKEAASKNLNNIISEMDEDPFSEE